MKKFVFWGIGVIVYLLCSRPAWGQIVCIDDSKPETCKNLADIPECSATQLCNCKGSGCSDPPPANECNQTTWKYKYHPWCVKPAEDPNDPGVCPGKWYFEFKDCSAADRCQDPSVGNNPGGCGGEGGTGSNSSGVILYGQCNASSCPEEGCQNGYWYKTCCFINDQDSSGGLLIGGKKPGFCQKPGFSPTPGWRPHKNG